MFGLPEEMLKRKKCILYVIMHIIHTNEKIISKQNSIRNDSTNTFGSTVSCLSDSTVFYSIHTVSNHHTIHTPQTPISSSTKSSRSGKNSNFHSFNSIFINLCVQSLNFTTPTSIQPKKNKQKRKKV